MSIGSSLALTLHGDLDLSVLDERPPGRKPVRTQLRGEKHRDAIYAFVNIGYFHALPFSDVIAQMVLAHQVRMTNMLRDRR